MYKIPRVFTENLPVSNTGTMPNKTVIHTSNVKQNEK